MKAEILVQSYRSPFQQLQLWKNLFIVNLAIEYPENYSAWEIALKIHHSPLRLDSLCIVETVKKPCP